MKKKVLVFSTTYHPIVGGAEVALKELTDRLGEFSFVLICARIRPELPDCERIGNVDVHRVGFGRMMDRYLLPILGPVRALRLDVRGAVVWSMMASYAGFASLFYCWLRPGSRLLLTLQEGDPLERYSRRLGPLGFLQRWLFRRADHVQAISRFLGEWAVNGGAKCPVDIIPNGVSVSQFARGISTEQRSAIRRSLGLFHDDIVLVSASRLVLKNALDDVIRALPLLEGRVKFLVVGVGEDEAMLRSLAKDLGVTDRVVFAGFCSHGDLPGILRASDIFIRPSLSEGLGNSFLEAMASGIPVIGTPVGGIPDFLVDGETGVLCKVRDASSIAASVHRLISDPLLRERVVGKAATLVRERYEWSEIASKIGAVLDLMIVNPRSQDRRVARERR